jgi:anthranilate synthase component 2
VKVLLLDNFDSFTFNLFHYLEELDCEVTVLRNNAFEIDELPDFDKIILSPGPGLPEEAGKMMELIHHFAPSKSILGVCLGMQALSIHFGGTLFNQQFVKHGIQEKCFHSNNSKLYTDIPIEFEVGLYHSWGVEIENTHQLFPTAYSENNILMSFEHESLPICGVQYHPESIMTSMGKKILANFIEKY